MEFDFNKVIESMSQRIAFLEGDNAVMKAQLLQANETIKGQQLVIEHYKKYGEPIKEQAEQDKNVEEAVKELEQQNEVVDVQD